MDGEVKLHLLKKLSATLQESLNPAGNHRSKNFKAQIRSYNAMFVVISMGGKVDHRINDGINPYIFKFNGQNHHRIGTLLLADGLSSSFAQLYFYDTEKKKMKFQIELMP
jgi:hypothetical protein